jgi:hypothetical protein
MKTTATHVSFSPGPLALARARDAIRGFLVRGGLEAAPAEAMVARIGDACTAAMARTGSGNDIEIDIHLEGSGVTALVKDAAAGVDLCDLGLSHRPLGPSVGGLYLMTCIAGAIEVSSGA